MRLPTLSGRLRETTALVALSATAILSCAAPAASLEQGIYGGGSTLASQAMRQLFDCYSGKTLDMDGFTFTTVTLTSTVPQPGKLPRHCTDATHHNTTIEGLYAAVGSGSGTGGFIANDPLRLLLNPSGTFLGNFPAVPPPPVDDVSADTNFSEYPYPRIDFGAGDSPLPGGLTSTYTNLTGFDWTSGAFTTTTSWQTLTASTIANCASPTSTCATSVAYPAPALGTTIPSTFGTPIQIPLFEAPVAIALNPGTSPGTVALSIFTGLGASGSPSTKPGGAIALSTAQLCAIFSGLVTDWGDSTTVIPYLDKLGHSHTTGTLSATMANFNAFANTTATMVTVPPSGSPYTSAASPIKVVYRSDGSGTSFILTNALQSQCPQLDGLGSTSGIYHSIFQTPGASGNTLPSTSFSKLIASVNSYWQANGRGPSYDITPTWDGQSGNQAVATEVGNTTSAPSHGGYIGYVSADFSSPYSNLGATITPDPSPWSASLQNEALRVGGHYFAGNTTATAFVAPNSGSVDKAFTNISAPATTSTWASWDLYGINYPSSGIGGTHGGVKYTGISELGLPNAGGAYPISGTTFAYLYSCYAGTHEANAIGDFFAWILAGAVTSPVLPAYNNTGLNPSNRSNPGKDADVNTLLANNSFHALHNQLAVNLLTEYIIPSSSMGHALSGSATAISDTTTNTDGCTGVTTGANNGHSGG
jgi:ABC-type phosphate transport system substrate-binding protein